MKLTHRFIAGGIAALAAAAVVLILLASTVNAAPVPPAPSAAPNPAWFNCLYIVRPGDTLYSIAARYGASPYALAEYNNLWNPSYLYPGMRLWVPCSHPPPPHYPTRPAPTPCANPATYVVKPGDNLFRIALNYGTTVNAIRDANNLWGRVLRPGMVLKIPCPNPNQPTATPCPPGADSVCDHPTATPCPPGFLCEVPEATPCPPGAVCENQNNAPTPVTAPQQPQGGPTVVPTASIEGNNQLPPEPSAQISLGANAADPQTVNIKNKQSVVWINNSQSTYTILSGIAGQPNGVFKSDPLPPGGTYVFTFDTLGNYLYYVQENPTIVGQINVTP